MAEEGKVFLDANGLYLDSFKLARAIWDDGFRPTVRVRFNFNAFVFQSFLHDARCLPTEAAAAAAR